MPERKSSAPKHHPVFRVRHPETSAITAGFDPELSVMAARPPIYPVSTYCFHTAAEAAHFFDEALGRTATGATVGHEGHAGLIYARLNNPNAEMFEDLMVPLEKGAAAAVSYASGMAAIAALLMTFLRPEDVIIHTSPVYGGTAHLIDQMLPAFGINGRAVDAGSNEELARAIDEVGGNLAMIYLETPANPTLRMSDIAAAAELTRAASSRGRRVYLAVDNTFLGPVFQAPLALGADFSVYSATKYIGGHSDVVAGVTLTGEVELATQLKTNRAFLGTILEPFSAWLLQRSLATIYTRTVKQSKNARRIVQRFEGGHPKLARIHYPTLFEGEQERIYKAQATAPGSMISFELHGGRHAAFRFIDALNIPKLAVSLGGVETLVTHPRSTTSSEMPVAEMERFGITEGLVRYSTGVEYWRDLADDIEQALAAV